MSSRRGWGCLVDEDCSRLSRCLRRLPAVSGPPMSPSEVADLLPGGSPRAMGPRLSPACRCLRPAALTAAPAAPRAPTPDPPPGRCVPSRVLGQPCTEDLDCSPGMACSGSLCACSLGLRYSRMRARCVGERQAHGLHGAPSAASPWNISPLDHPPIADMDAEVVETIPATYDCPLLVGMISVVLVLICLIVAAYCRFTDPPPKPPGYRPARTERDESYPGYPDQDPFDWSSETSPLRSSWAGDSDMSSLRRVKYCTCDPPPQPLPGPATPAASPLVAPSSPPSPLLQLQLPPLPPVREAVRLHLQQVQAVR